ncbi:MAG: zf-TFIIB domain-containing protein [Acidimicrobiia bacterium]
MNCPFCSTPLRVVNRQGIDVDWCPDCKGIWLERGELEKLIERNDDRDDRDREDRDREDRDRDDRDLRYRRDDRYERYERYEREPQYTGKRKKKSFLSEIFEFGE